MFDQDNNIINVRMTPLPFASYDNGKINFDPLPEDEGVHLIFVNLTDVATPSRTSTYSFKLFVENKMKYDYIKEYEQFSKFKARVI